MPRKNQDIRFGPTMTALRGLTCPHNTHGRQRQSCRWFSDLWRPASDWRAFDSPRAAIGSQNSWNAGVRIMPSLTAHGGAWTEHILYSFPGYGLADPAGQMALGSDGTIYGATYEIFQLAPPTVRGGSWTESVVYSFVAPGDSPFPNGVVLGPGGVLYGTAFGGSGKACDSGCGSVFQLTPPTEQGGEWTETILHSFTGVGTGDGNQPNSTPVIGPGGVLYGTTLSGGTTGHGAIFEMVPPSSPGGSWTEVILHSFAGGADGTYPNAVTIGPDGNLYGTTQQGGAPKDGVHNQGTVFQLVLQ